MSSSCCLRVRKHGGLRPGAGRPRNRVRHDADHVRRPEVNPKHPLHVVLRTVPGVPRLRSAAIFPAIRAAIARTMRSAFRVVHTSIQGNHLHFIVEAERRELLTRGMQALAIIAARAINRVVGRTGKVFAHRYHATPIRSPRQMRHTLAYVLNNWRRHGEDRASARAGAAAIDPYSTAIWFGGWKGVGRFRWRKTFEPLPSANPTTWLLTVGWLTCGAIDPRERPGPKPRRAVG